MEESSTTGTEKLQAENKRLKQLLEEYNTTALQKNTTPEGLEESTIDVAALKSYYDLQTEELKFVRYYIQELKEKAEAAVQRETQLEKELTQSVSTSYQLEDIKSKYNHLQAQLNDIEEMLQQLSSQNILQILQTSRIAELESMLANAEEEIDLLKNNMATEN
jgi:DNA repair exonuclease SbcCD ATPase subunit